MTRGQTGHAGEANTALELVALKPDFRVMNETDASAREPEDAFAAAEQRLKRALGAIESRFKALQARAEAAKGDEAATSATHAHVEGGDTVSDCDHCCHASAHLIALAPTSGAHESLAAGRHRPQAVASVPQSVPEPPFTPPIV